MIEIIRHGDKKRKVCPNCSCIFTYEKEDTRTEDLGMNEWKTVVFCPDCGEKLEVRNG